MHIRMVWGIVKKGMWDEYESYYNEHIEPATKGRQGFRGRQLLRSTENPDEGVSITLWGDYDALLGNVGSPERRETAKGGEHLYTGEYWAKNFEVMSTTL